MTEFTALLGEEFLKYKPLSQTRAHTPLTHAQRALHFECRGAPVVRRGDARVAPPCPTTPRVCGEVYLTLPYLARSAHRTVLQM